MNTSFRVKKGKMFSRCKNYSMAVFCCLLMVGFLGVDVYIFHLINPYREGLCYFVNQNISSLNTTLWTSYIVEDNSQKNFTKVMDQPIFNTTRCYYDKNFNWVQLDWPSTEIIAFMIFIGVIFGSIFCFSASILFCFVRPFHSSFSSSSR